MSLIQKLKEILISDLNLEDLTVDEIADDDALFVEGVGLDSLDAVELVVVVKKHFGVEMDNMDEAKKAFESVKVLAAYIEEHQS
jgi:acyl carrier protein